MDAVGTCLGHRTDPHAGLVGQGSEVGTDAESALRDDVAAPAHGGGDGPAKQSYDEYNEEVRHDESIAPQRVGASDS
jgi:hypothetical protein